MARRNASTDIFKHIDMSAGPTACWPWKLSLSDKGLPYFSYEGKRVVAYRLAWELVNGRSMTKDEVARHTCHNGPAREKTTGVCCNPRHIIPGSHQDNMNDMKLAGRSAKKLNELAIFRIRELFDKDMTQQAIADAVSQEFGVRIARETVRDVLSGKNHEHVVGENK